MSFHFCFKSSPLFFLFLRCFCLFFLHCSCPPSHFIDGFHSIVQPLELGLQHVYIHTSMDTERIASLGNGGPKAILSDAPFFIHPTHMDRMHPETARECIVGVGHR